MKLNAELRLKGKKTYSRPVKPGVDDVNPYIERVFLEVLNPTPAVSLTENNEYVQLVSEASPNPPANTYSQIRARDGWGWDNLNLLMAIEGYATLNAHRVGDTGTQSSVRVIFGGYRPDLPLFPFGWEFNAGISPAGDTAGFWIGHVGGGILISWSEPLSPPPDDYTKTFHFWLKLQKYPWDATKRMIEAGWASNNLTYENDDATRYTSPLWAGSAINGTGEVYEQSLTVKLINPPI